MTEVLHSSPSSSPSSLSCAPSSTPIHNDALFLTQEEEGDSRVTDADRDHLSLLALLLTLLRKSFWVACTTEREELCGMEIGWPTNVRHVAHVTFDRFNGFLGLPVEFEPEVPRRAPSARGNAVEFEPNDPGGPLMLATFDLSLIGRKSGNGFGFVDVSSIVLIAQFS
ncbi:Rho GTPase activating protein with PAK-box/P21-Rho-binding domain-containing protein [Actinidia rufa]|uniref:Rho GTPase activating protein with PAK-box/P21-Rho-binding domain-containing protein n=1 Tax=Actinidia rufa TaxID=165716 RepID=A0A7J0HAV0_9ERIC|nr:Rho GTPase activating protein with PAK-box/P21-Rho-binding domain-containing protein [Actinidia rufa]